MKTSIQFVASILLILFASATIVQSCKSKKTKEPAGPTAEELLQKKVERGKYLAYHVSGCIDCHSKRDFNYFGGPVVPGSEGMGGFEFNMQNVGAPGIIYSKNITPSGIGDWTDEEIMRALTKGISKTGDTLFPLMPYVHYQGMSKYDLESIIAFLRTLPVIKNEIPKRSLLVPISAVYSTLPLNMTGPDSTPSMNDKIRYGEYMVNIAACSDCHTPRDIKGEFIFEKTFAGGYCFYIPQGNVCSANITPDSSTGIGTWTEEAFLAKFTAYRAPEAKNMPPGDLYTIMPWEIYAGMTDEDLKAIYAYLHNGVKPVENLVEKRPKVKL